jgi:hypothetical protein
VRWVWALVEEASLVHTETPCAWAEWPCGFFDIKRGYKGESLKALQREQAGCEAWGAVRLRTDASARQSVVVPAPRGYAGCSSDYAAIGELLGGNTRTEIWASPAYCRVLPRNEGREIQRRLKGYGVESLQRGPSGRAPQARGPPSLGRFGATRGCARKGSYRFVPPGTGWDRLGPDKFFSPHGILGKDFTAKTPSRQGGDTNLPEGKSFRTGKREGGNFTEGNEGDFNHRWTRMGRVEHQSDEERRTFRSDTSRTRCARRGPPSHGASARQGGVTSRNRAPSPARLPGPLPLRSK